jgi:hypothetical protein
VCQPSHLDSSLKKPGALGTYGVWAVALFVTPGAVVLAGIGGRPSDSVNVVLSKDFPVVIRSGEVPEGNPSIGLIPSLTDSELKSECTWIRVGDGASLQTSLGVLGARLVSEE